MTSLFNGLGCGRQGRQQGRTLVHNLILLIVALTLLLVAWLLLSPAPQTHIKEPYREPTVGVVKPLGIKVETPSADALVTPAEIKEAVEKAAERVESPPDAGAMSDDRRTSGGERNRRPLPNRLDQLPRLDESDEPFRTDLESLDDRALLLDHLISEELIRKLVVTVDNLAEGRIALKHSLLKPPSGDFRVAEAGEKMWLDGISYGRYVPYMTLVEALDLDQIVSFYVHYYPLMQQAYAELGYGNRAFHDRVLQALERILAARPQAGPLELVQPSVRYKFADPTLEKRSAVEKQILRLGPVQAAKLLTFVSQVRTRLGHFVAP